MRIRESFLSFMAVVLSAAPVYGQTIAVKTYLQEAKPGDMLPMSNTKAFIDYAAASGLRQLTADAVTGQFNKLLGSSVGSSGTTSLTSGSAVSSVLSLAMEYGAINETNSGNVATIRTNLFALAQPLVGGSALPACTETSKISPCNEASRWLRKFSASYSAETSGTGSAMAAGANAQTGATNTANIFAGGYRTAGWSARVDWLAANPYQVAGVQFTQAMMTIGASAQFASLEQSVVALWDKAPVPALYRQWSNDTTKDLDQAVSETDRERRLGTDLDKLIALLRANDKDFDTNIGKAQTAYGGYYDLLDSTIQSLQTNKFSTEFTSQHPLGQANTSNFRAIYSWQPTKTPLLFTFNGAVTWYDSIPADIKPGKVGKLRDAQFSAQVDRKIGSLGSIKNSVFTIAGYYQWQLQNALITIGDGTVAPGTGITLPGSAATLLAPKGNIAIAQLKWTLPIMNGVVKIPFSFTWSNRTELIDESEKRGQVGLTLDLDAAFAKGSQ